MTPVTTPPLVFGAAVLKTYGDAPFSINAPAGGGTYTYSSSNANVATIAASGSGALVTIVGAGTASLIATSGSGARSTSYLKVNKALPKLTLQSFSGKLYAGFPDVDASYAPDYSAPQALEPLTTSSNTATPITYKLGPITPAAGIDPTATIAELASTPGGTKLLPYLPGKGTIIATQAATANYEKGTASIEFTINRITSRFGDLSDYLAAYDGAVHEFSGVYMQDPVDLSVPVQDIALSTGTQSITAKLAAFGTLTDPAGHFLIQRSGRSLYLRVLSFPSDVDRISTNLTVTSPQTQRLTSETKTVALTVTRAVGPPQPGAPLLGVVNVTAGPGVVYTTAQDPAWFDPVANLIHVKVCKASPDGRVNSDRVNVSLAFDHVFDNKVQPQIYLNNRPALDGTFPTVTVYRSDLNTTLTLKSIVPAVIGGISYAGKEFDYPVKIELVGFPEYPDCAPSGPV